MPSERIRDSSYVLLQTQFPRRRLCEPPWEVREDYPSDTQLLRQLCAGIGAALEVVYDQASSAPAPGVEEPVKHSRSHVLRPTVCCRHRQPHPAQQGSDLLRTDDRSADDGLTPQLRLRLSLYGARAALEQGEPPRVVRRMRRIQP